MDPERICRLAASCEEARRIDETHYEGMIKAKLGFASVRARILGEVLESYEPNGMVVDLHGETLGLPGSFHGVANLSMSPEGVGTHAHYTFDITFLGRLDTLGKPFFQMTAQHVAHAFARKVSAHLATG